MKVFSNVFKLLAPLSTFRFQTSTIRACSSLIKCWHISQSVKFNNLLHHSLDTSLWKYHEMCNKQRNIIFVKMSTQAHICPELHVPHLIRFLVVLRVLSFELQGFEAVFALMANLFIHFIWIIWSTKIKLSNKMMHFCFAMHCDLVRPILYIFLLNFQQKKITLL